VKRLECEFEAEVLAAVLQCRWPDRIGTELHAHVSVCEICSDVVAIAGAIEGAREDTRAQAAIPDAGRVWWLAQMRAHREAVEAAGRPITAAQAIAFTCAIGLLGACFGATSSWFQSALHSVTSGSLLPSAFGVIATHGAVLLAMTALVFLVPAVLWLTVLRD